MITVLKKGYYRLGETKNHTKILFLDETCYLWITVPGIGDILSTTPNDHEFQTLFSDGKYKLYDIKHEPDLVDLRHLELETGHQHWQGFLLLTGLPHKDKRRSRIIPTKELVKSTNNKSFKEALMKLLPKRNFGSTRNAIEAWGLALVLGGMVFSYFLLDNLFLGFYAGLFVLLYLLISSNQSEQSNNGVGHAN